MSKPSWMLETDWKQCKFFADAYGTYPELLAAIGWHETHWGQLGWGKKGFYLGVGCYSATKANYEFQGLNKQLNWAAKKLGEYIGKNVTHQALTNFAYNVWKPGVPSGWANSVYNIYVSLGGITGKENRILKKGYRGNDVKEVQERLNELGYNAGTVDGIFGDKTEAAVIAFQLANGLTPDGIVGEKTKKALFEDYKPAEPGEVNLGSDSDSNISSALELKAIKNILEEIRDIIKGRK